MFLTNQNAEIVVVQKIAPQAESEKYFQIWFFPRFGGKNGGVLSMRMQVILDFLFVRPGSAPIWGVTLLKLKNLNQKETSFVSVREEKETERT